MQIARREGWWTRAAGVVSLSLLAAGALGAGQEPPQVNRSLKILYAGRPGSDREKDFVAFLQKHFDVVRTGNLRTFQAADAQNVDVTLLDWDWNVSPGYVPRIPESFSRPILTLGVYGGFICSQWNLKTAYL